MAELGHVWECLVPTCEGIQVQFNGTGSDLKEIIDRCKALGEGSRLSRSIMLLWA